MGKCNKEDCIYKGVLSHIDRTPICCYCLETGMSRGCDADDCTHYLFVNDIEKIEIVKSRLSKLIEV